MVGLPYDCIANPFGAVRLAFEEAVASGCDQATYQGKDWGASDLFRKFLFDNDGLSQVPMLNGSTIGSLEPNTLVRFRGMIQDMLGKKFYVGAYKDGDVWRTNKYADVSQFPMESSRDMQLWERRLLCCVPVPGQNPWTESFCEAVVSPFTNSISPPKENRQREDEVPMDDADMQAPDHELQVSPSAERKREERIPLQSSNLQQNVIGGTCSTTGSVPYVDRNSFPCLVKIYDSPASDLKLNDVFEFVGVLTFNTELKTDKDEIDELDNNLYEEAMTHLFPSKPTSHLVKGIRESLLGTAVLGNDGLAAQFMLLHLLSRVEYDFTYYKIEMAADVQVLILSEGKSNILPDDLVLPFHPSSKDCCDDVDPEALRAWRWYLATMRSLTHTIEEDMQKVVEDDLVAARHPDRSLGSQELSRLLTMGRLVSASFGEQCLSLDHWQMVKELERLRSERLQEGM